MLTQEDRRTFTVTPFELVALLGRSRRVLHPLGRLPGLFGVRSARGGEGWADARADPESVADAAAALEAEGRVEVWEHPDRGPVVVLSALSAQALGLELAGDGRTWQPRGKAKRPTKVKRRDLLRAEVESAGFDFSDAKGMTVVPAPKARRRKADEGCGPRQLAYWFSVGRAGFWSLSPRPGARPGGDPGRIVLVGGCRDLGARRNGGGGE